MGPRLFRTLICFLQLILVSKLGIADTVDYRLPTIYSPSTYEINLHLDKGIFSGTQSYFEGDVAVTFTVLEDTKIVKIHGSVTINTLVLSSGSTTLKATYTYEPVSELLTIAVESTLTPNTTYILNIDYIGNLDLVDMKGFYRSDYFNENGEKVYLVTTQFQPTHARKAFPCFDEPRYKAKFSINITYPTGLLALGNTPSLSPVPLGDGMETITFMETPIMPTYLIAFIVSDFNCTYGEPIDTNVPHGVCSTNESISDRSLAVEYGPKIMHALESMTGLKYKDQGLGKMHQAALPDFSAGAMENWGLVTYRESALLWNKLTSSNSYKERVLTIIAHEFAHMWFGNLVTCDWWDYTFLNEGFARYFQYFSLTKITEVDVDEVWEMAKQFIVEQQQSIFTSDSSKNSMSLTSVSASPQEVSNKFSSISYNKGASVIRMLENIMGTDNFFKGLNEYLKANSYSTTVPNKLWAALEVNMPSGRLPPGATLMTVMENWVNSSGFPLVTVSLTDTNYLKISQERFLYNSSDTDDTQYYVPLSMTTSTTSNPFIDTSPGAWLTPDGFLVTGEQFSENDWVIVNNQESAYYRVNYDDELWRRIKEVLQNNHTAIHVINRAQLVDDVINVARANITTYSQALSVLSYLRKETEYYPWYSAIVGLNYLYRMYGENSETGTKLVNFEKELIQGVLESVSFSKTNETNQIYSLKLGLILNRACKLGISSTINNATEQFQRYRTGSSIDKNLRATVYCNGLRYGGIDDWQFVWEKFVSETGSTEKLVLMSALGCTTDEQNLKYFLNQTITPDSSIRQQDISSAWSAVYTANPQNIGIALDFFLQNYERIYSNYASASSLLSNLAIRITSNEELKMLTNALVGSENSTTSILRDINSAISSAEANMKWANERKSQIDEYFQSITTSAPVTTTVAPVTTTAAPVTTTAPPVTPPSTASPVPAPTTASPVPAPTTASPVTPPTSVPSPSTICSTSSQATTPETPKTTSQSPGSTPVTPSSPTTPNPGGSGSMIQAISLVQLVAVTFAVAVYYI